MFCGRERTRLHFAYNSCGGNTAMMMWCSRNQLSSLAVWTGITETQCIPNRAEVYLHVCVVHCALWKGKFAKFYVPKPPALGVLLEHRSPEQTGQFELAFGCFHYVGIWPMGDVFFSEAVFQCYDILALTGSLQLTIIFWYFWFRRNLGPSLWPKSNLVSFVDPYKSPHSFGSRS